MSELTPALDRATDEPKPAPEPVTVGPGPELARTALHAALTHQ